MGIYPLINSLYISFFDWNIKYPGRFNFIGLENYLDAVRDPIFLASLVRSFIWTATSVSVELVLGLALALLFNREFRVAGFARVLLLTPMIISPIAVGISFKYMYNEQFGVINFIMKLMQIPTKAWLSDVNAAFVACLVADVWQWTPFMFLILFAGLQSLPKEPLEAARIDATGWQTFRYVILPMMKRVIMIATLLRLIDAFKLFDLVFAMTHGGPGMVTELISVYIWRNGFRYLRMSYASALSYMLLIIVTVISMPFIRQLTREA